MIFMNEEKYTPPKSESNTDEDNVWYFDNGVSNHMTALIKGTRLEAAGNEQPLTGYDGNPFHGYNNPRATVYSPRDTANNPRVTVHATITDEQESDIDDLFAPIARLQTIRPLIALAAGKGWKTHQLGYENDFSKW
ncbi:hypothetical protein Tco_0121231 [Tanacetum coccineum]